MKKIPILTTIMILLTALFIGCTERTSRYLPQEIAITQPNKDTRIYKFLYDEDCKLLGFDIAYTHTSKEQKTEFTDSVRFNYGQDGRLVRSSHISGNPNRKSTEVKIYYMDDHTIQFDAPDSTKTTLKINDYKQLLAITTEGYEAGYLYDSLARVKAIVHNILVRDTTIHHAQGLFRISMNYQHPRDEMKGIFCDLDFPEWMLLYYGLEVLMFNPTEVVTQADTTQDAMDRTSLAYEYNSLKFPTKIKMEGHNSMLIDIKYCEVK